MSSLWYRRDSGVQGRQTCDVSPVSNPSYFLLRGPCLYEDITRLITCPLLYLRAQYSVDMAALLVLPLFIAQVIAIDDGNCLAAAWLPEGSQQPFCAEPGFEYDGSLLPDCQAFEGQVNTTSFYHVHEFGKSAIYAVKISVSIRIVNEKGIFKIF